jgi:hypothetical protein
MMAGTILKRVGVENIVWNKHYNGQMTDAFSDDAGSPNLPSPFQAEKKLMR